MANINCCVGQFKLIRPEVNRLICINPQTTPSLNFLPAGVDEHSVVCNGTKESIFDFLMRIDAYPFVIVLTDKEREILTRFIIHTSRILVAENLFPYLKTKIKYLPDSNKNFNCLISILRKEPELKSTGGFIDQFGKECFYKVARKLKKKSTLDLAFSLIPNNSLQEVFVLQEMRPNRRLLALDINSMFASVMQQPFTDPRDLFYIKYDRYIPLSESILPGCYHVKLEKPKTNWISTYHQIQYYDNNRFLFFQLRRGDVVECWLTWDELNFYRQYFEKIFCIEAINAKKTIKHPLSKNILGIYQERQHYKNQGNEVETLKAKLKLASAYSCCKRRFQMERLIEIEQLQSYLKEIGINTSGKSSWELIFQWKNSPRLSLKERGNKVLVQHEFFSKNQQVLSLYSEVIAKARIELLKKIEYLSKFSGLEICYCNVDSVHVSIPDDKYEDFYIYAKKIIGSGIGQFKVEAEARQGIWLAPGHYCLFSGNNVVKSKNAGIRQPIDKFRDRYTFKTFAFARGLTVPINRNMTLDRYVRVRKYAELNNDFCKLYRWNIEEIPGMLEKIYTNAELKETKEVLQKIFESLSENLKK